MSISYHVEIVPCLLHQKCSNSAENNNYNDFSLVFWQITADASLVVDHLFHCYSRNSSGLIIPQIINFTPYNWVKVLRKRFELHILVLYTCSLICEEKLSRFQNSIIMQQLWREHSLLPLVE